VPASQPRPSPAPRPQLNYVKAGVTILVGIYGIVCALSPKTYRFLDYVNLIFHEAGHPLFGLFGEFIGALGGTLMQLLVPAIVAGYFFFYNQQWSGTVVLFWLGQSFFNVSVYVKDARARALPLLGDDPSAHDWSFILGGLGLREYDQGIGTLVYLTGLLALIASIAGGLYFSMEEPSLDE
jgi:hypothetical protein